MCGIAGIVNVDMEPLDIYTLMQMQLVQNHRGPDGKSILLIDSRGSNAPKLIVDDANLELSVDSRYNVGLVHNRLAIIDIKTGHQPLTNEEGTIYLIANGEIYNHEELRVKLLKKGHILKTNSDFEVVVHLYEELGEDCVSELSGMFVFAIWDSRNNILFMARDSFGLKPLHFFYKNGIFIFASEIRAIMQYPRFNKELDTKAIDLFMSFWSVPEPYCIFKNIEKLPAGSTLTLKEGNVRVNKYWKFSFVRDSDSLGERYYIDQGYRLLKEAVKKQLMSDVPFGAFLSGGIDSSTIVYLMSEIMEEPVKTFSIGFELKEYSELEFSHLIAKHCKTNHHEMIITEDAVLNVIPMLFKHIDEPFGDPSVIPTYFVSKIASNKVKVVLTGEGGDEIFGGYPWHKLSGVNLDKWLFNIPSSFQRPFFYFSGFLPKFLSRDLKYLNLQENICNGGMQAFSLGLKKMIYSEKLIEELHKDNYTELNVYYRDKYLENNLLNSMQNTDIETYLLNDLLVKVDRASMMNSLEARIPFLDQEFALFMSKVPSRLRLKNGLRKYLLKKMMLGKLPDEILFRRKMGFSMPLNLWFNKPKLGRLFNEVIGDSTSGFFNKDQALCMLDHHKSGKKNYAIQLWCIIAFELWYRNWKMNLS